MLALQEADVESGLVCKAWVNITEDGDCPPIVDKMPPEDYNKYAFVMDLDGRGYSGRFHQLLSENTPVLKQVGLEHSSPVDSTCSF